MRYYKIYKMKGRDFHLRYATKWGRIPIYKHFKKKGGFMI